MNVDLNLLGWGGDVIVWGGVLTEQARSELVDRRVAVLCRKDLRYEQFEGVGVVKLDVGVPMEFSRPAPNRRHLCGSVKGPPQVIRKDKIVSIVSRAEFVSWSFCGSRTAFDAFSKASRSGPWANTWLWSKQTPYTNPPILASSKPFHEPVGDQLHDVGSHHHWRRELRIIARKAVAVLYKKMVKAWNYARGHVLVAAALERCLL